MKDQGGRFDPPTVVGLSKDVNTMSRVRKVAVAAKQIETEAKIKLGFSGITARGDINKRRYC